MLSNGNVIASQIRPELNVKVQEIIEQSKNKDKWLVTETPLEVNGYSIPINVMVIKKK